jgi:hypothetical protein
LESISAEPGKRGIGGQVNSKCESPGEGPFDARVPMVFLVLFDGLLVRLTGHPGTAAKNHDVVRCAPMRGRPPADIADKRSGDRRVRATDEHAFGMVRGELSSARRRSRLMQQLPSLR